MADIDDVSDAEAVARLALAAEEYADEKDRPVRPTEALNVASSRVFGRCHNYEQTSRLRSLRSDVLAAADI